MSTTTRKAGSGAKKSKAAFQTEIRVRIDARTKDRAERLFKRHGMTTSDGLRILINRALEEKDLPHIPNPETRKTIEAGLAEKSKPVTRADIRLRSKIIVIPNGGRVGDAPSVRNDNVY